MPTTTNFGWTTPADTDLVKDGAAAIRTLGNGIDTSLLDLKGGTTGQILSKASNTDLDFTWIANDQGDITAVTAGTGITGGGTSGAVTITNDMATKIDAKGDLIVGTGADAYDRLAVGGTNGFVLQVDSTAATGMKWAAAPAVGKTWTLLNAGGTALTGATTITVSGISDKDDLIILVSGASSANVANLSLRINTDTGANYNYYGQQLTYTSTYGSTVLQARNSTGDTSIQFGGMGTNAASLTSGFCKISGGKSTGIKVFNASSMASAGGGDSNAGYTIGGYYNGSAAITSISIVSSSGNFDAGTIWVYGA